MELQKISKSQDPKVYESRNRDFMTVCVRDDMALEVANTDVAYETGDTFEGMGIETEIIKGLRSEKIIRPSLIQSNILPYVFSESPRNIISQAQSGTGKTISYIIIALQAVEVSNNCTQILILTPTMELSYQVYQKMMSIGKFVKGLRVNLAIRNSTPSSEEEAHIIIGCCGTILRWINSEYVDLSACKIFILDEADAIVQQHNQFEQMKSIKQSCHDPCLHLFFSATFSDDSFDIVKDMMYDPMSIRLRPEQLTVKNIQQYYCKTYSNNDKISLLTKVIRFAYTKKMIVFCNRKEQAKSISKSLGLMGVHNLMITGEMEAEERKKSFNLFTKESGFSLLVCTDVCSRGIDINQVNVVINYNIPLTKKSEPDYSTYYHRIGRGGRFGCKSTSFTFTSNANEEKFIKLAEKYFKIVIPELDLHEKINENTLQKIIIEDNHTINSGQMIAY